MINETVKMNIGIDFHDTLSHAPDFFKNVLSSWPGKVFIVTGTPLSKIDEVRNDLNDLGFHDGTYHEILCGFEYEKSEMTLKHFHKMAEHKVRLIKAYDIQIFFDDNPFYVKALKDKGIKVFQTILGQKYLDDFKKADPFFTCNLQANQFDYLKGLNDETMVKKKGDN
ncbi:MAG: hypothetical protein H8E12_19965 [Rhodobacteraceae bacterium]|nr:hypothetical protein [Paracoccaceae bacterium]